jgi:hypothetical protein
MLPAWSGTLANLYWWLRASWRGHPKPSRRTWHRRIRAEKLRLFQAGIPAIEIHLVSRCLASPKNQVFRRRWQRYLDQQTAGTSPWPPRPP